MSARFRRPTIVIATVVACSWFFSGLARAEGSLDVGRAQADANAVLADHHEFCDRPRTPTSDSLRLCSLSKEIPNCAGFAKQCATYLEPKVPESPPRWLESIARAIATIAPYVGWTILVGGVATILYLIANAIWRRIKNAEDEVEQEDTPADVMLIAEAAPAPVETGSAEAILARAEAAFARGDLHAALFGFLHAALRALDVRGAIRIARDRTNGEYVRSCGDEQARPDLRAIVYEVDVVQFGGRSPEVERVREAGRRAAALVRAGLIAALVVFTLGCKPPSLPKANDPAGFDIAPLLLAKQGFTLRAPDKPLARLEAPSGDTPSRPMLLDTTRTPLDTDAVEGLQRWVKGGGTLVLFGPVYEWPTEFRGVRVPTKSRDVVVQANLTHVDCDEATDECEEKASQALEKLEMPPQRARLADEDAFKWAEQAGRPIAFHEGDGTVYAAFGDFGAGSVLGVASADLLTNAGLAREGNPAALIALLSHLSSRELLIVDEHGGITPSGDPLSALLKAGLGLPLGHALAFAVLMAFAVGARHRAARPFPQSARRAFVEHVEATGALYAYAKAAPHALASYGRFVVERMRTRMAKGADLPTTLSQRSGVDREECQRILDRATLTKAGDAVQGDELATLRQLAELYARAADPMSPATSGSHVAQGAKLAVSTGERPSILGRFGFGRSEKS